MRWTHLFLYLFIFVISSGIYTTASDASCDPTEFTCKNGRCINLAWKCDGDDDCHDHSDEKECSPTTCSDNFFRCDDGKCIPDRWVCDDSSECRDDSDEKPELCKNRTCSGYRCNDSDQCIPEDWKCDGRADCPKEDDEAGCSSVCDSSTEFKCNNTNCISIRWKCDGHDDCSDGSDEKECPKSECDAVGEKQCSDGECINDLWWCDGDADCGDKSDEVNCTNKKSGQTCGSNEFQCQLPTLDVQCIHFAWKCDGDDDCTDGSDELGCTKRTCSSDEKMCGNNLCIKATYFCDGENDCDDGEDEKNCNHTVAPAGHCKVSEFDCGTKCISDQLICNGADDCGNGADEASDRHCPLGTNNTCAKNNGGCNQICIPNTDEESGRKCECYIGFDFKDNSDTECEDIDECKITGTCSQKCTNTKGSYKCDCFAGYTLTDHRYCKASDGSHPELILSDRHAIRRYHLDTFHYSPLLQQEVSGAVAMDFDIRNKTVFWIDVHSEKICSSNLESNETKVIVQENISMPDGLAVDWIHMNLYLSDTGLDRIEVARLDGSHRKTLVNKSLDEPRALVVDPSSGWMYWTDWGSLPKIEKCGMNGQQRKAIVTQGIAWPNGLTIDYVQNRLYWVDAKLHSIGSSDLDGKNFKLILKNHRNLGHPFAITVFEDYLYWTDWLSNAVHRVSKFGRGNFSTIAMDLKTPMDIHVYHINRQPDSVNNCGDNNGGCSHLCLPVPQMKTNSPIPKKSECACPDTMILDGHFNCIQSPETVTTKKVSPQVTEVTSPNRPQTAGPNDLKTTVNLEAETTENSEDTTVKTETEDQTSRGISVNKTHREMEHKDEDAGYIAGIAIGSLVLFGLCAIVAVYLLLNRHRSRNVKSMNFDNPVYRKTTTEDQLIMEKNGSRSNLPLSMQPLNQDNDIV